ncbi:hypothetical protein ACPCG0_09700 [Propionibacteriaceae bacterium Y1923]
MKTYRRHRCTRQHKTCNRLARCMWPRASWVVGEGPLAVVARCKLTVSLHDSERAAKQALADVDEAGCSGNCKGSGHHELVHLVLGDVVRVPRWWQR